MENFKCGGLEPVPKHEGTNSDHAGGEEVELELHSLNLDGDLDLLLSKVPSSVIHSYGFDALDLLDNEVLCAEFHSILATYDREQVMDFILMNQPFCRPNSNVSMELCVNKFFRNTYYRPSETGININTNGREYTLDFPELVSVKNITELEIIMDCSWSTDYAIVSLKNRYHQELFCNNHVMAHSPYVKTARNILKSVVAISSAGINPAVVQRKLDNFNIEYKKFSDEGKILFALAMIDSNFMFLLEHGVCRIKGGQVPVNSILTSVFSLFDLFVFTLFSVILLIVVGFAVIPLHNLGVGSVYLPRLVGGALKSKPTARKTSVPNKKKFEYRKPPPKKPAVVLKIREGDNDFIRKDRVVKSQIFRKAISGVNGSGVSINTFEPFGKPHKFSTGPPTYLMTNSSGDIVELSRVNVCSLDCLFKIYLESFIIRNSESYDQCLENFNMGVVTASAQPAFKTISDRICKPKPNGNYEIPPLTDEEIYNICLVLNMKVAILNPGDHVDGSENWDPSKPNFELRVLGAKCVIDGIEDNAYLNGLINYVPEVMNKKNGKDVVVSEGHFNLIRNFEFNPTFDFSKTFVGEEAKGTNYCWLDLVYSYRRTMNCNGVNGTYPVNVSYFKLVQCPKDLLKKRLYSKINVDAMKSEKPVVDFDTLPAAEILGILVTFNGEVKRIEYTDLDARHFVLNRALAAFSLKQGFMMGKNVDIVTKRDKNRFTAADNDKLYILVSCDDKLVGDFKPLILVHDISIKKQFDNGIHSYEVKLGHWTMNGIPSKPLVDLMVGTYSFGHVEEGLFVRDSLLLNCDPVVLIFEKPKEKGPLSDFVDDDSLCDSSSSEESEETESTSLDTSTDSDVPDIDFESKKFDESSPHRDSIFGDDDLEDYLPSSLLVKSIGIKVDGKPEVVEDNKYVEDASAPFLPTNKLNVDCTIIKVTDYFSEEEVSTSESSSEVEEETIGMRFEWNVRYPKLNLTVRRSLSKLEDLFCLFPGVIGTCIFSSKICQSYLRIKFNGKWFSKFRIVLSQMKYSLTTNEGRSYLAAIRECVVKTKSSKLSTYNTMYWRGDFVGSSMSLKKQCDEMRLRRIGDSEADDVLDYARSVNQLHDFLELYVAAIVENKDFNLEDDEQFLIYLNELATTLGTFDFPVVTAGGLIKNKRVTFLDLNNLERVLFLSVLNEGFKVMRSTFVYDHNSVRQLLSPKVITGCKTFKDVDDRINGNASSVLAKFKTRKNLFMEGVDLFQNSVFVAKRLGYVYVERATGIQAISEVEKNFEGVEEVVHKFLPKSRYGIIRGSTTRYNKVAYNIAGYRTVEDRDMPHPGKVVKNFMFHEKEEVRTGDLEPRESDRVVRKAVGITNYNVKHNLAPIPDIDDSNNVKEGLMKRIGIAVPEPDEFTKIVFPLYVEHWIERKGIRGSIIELLVEDIEEMLDWEKYKLTLRYSPARRRQLETIRKEVDEFDTFEFADTAEGKLMNYLWTKVEMHVKWESYHGEKKFVRGIFARMDHFKVYFGCWAKIIQRIMYKKLDTAVTDKPVRELPQYLLDKFKDCDLIFCGDFSAFESHNYPWMMQNCCTRIETAMLVNEITTELVRCFEVCMSRQVIENKWQAAELDAKMMSGEVLTTVRNTQTTELILSFIMETESLVTGTGFYKQHPALDKFRRVHRRLDGNFEIKLVVAGDDSVCGVSYDPDVDYTKYTETNYLERYGCKLKLEIKDSINGSGFLSKLYSENDLKTLCDPLKHLSKGVLPMKYANSKSGVKRALARARAMSLKYEFDGCPIVGAYADCILRCTSGISINKALVYMELDDPYNYNRIVEAVSWFENLERDLKYGSSSKIGIESRIIIEDSFGISVSAQIAVEEYFENFGCHDFPLEFDVPVVDLFCPDANQIFYQTHLSLRDETLPVKDRSLCNLGLMAERPLHDLDWVSTDWFDLCHRLSVVCP